MYGHLKQIDFLVMSSDEKYQHILKLQARREQLKRENLHEKHRKATGSRKKKKPFKFASPELEAMFNSMPEDFRAAVLGQKK